MSSKLPSRRRYLLDGGGIRPGARFAAAIVAAMAGLAVVLVPAGAAYAGDCTENKLPGDNWFCGRFYNQTSSRTAASANWCGDSGTAITETCSGVLVLPGGSYGGVHPEDADGFRADANCDTTFSIAVAGYSETMTLHRIGGSSVWVKIYDGFDATALNKTCSPPRYVTASTLSNSEILVTWNTLWRDSSNYSGDVRWRVRRINPNGSTAIVFTGVLGPGQVKNSAGTVVETRSPGRVGFRDQGLAGNSTYRYTVTVYYQSPSYEGPQSILASATTSPNPPPVPPDPPSSGESPPAGQSPSLPTSLTPTRFGDIDGDGRDEIISIWSNGDVYAYRNQGWDGTTYSGDNYKLIAGGFTPAQTHFADIDGDGRDEIISIWPNGDVYAYRNQGWDDATYVGSNYKLLAQGFGIESTRFADIDGDGRAEIISIWPNGDVYAYRNQGWDGDTYVGNNNKLIAQGFSPDDIRTRFADIDGDGRDEIIDIYSDSDVHAWLNQGWSGTTYAGAVHKVVAGGGFWQSAVLFADLDGDGRDELINNHRAGNVDAYLNEGGWSGTTYVGANVKIVASGFVW